MNKRILFFLAFIWPCQFANAQGLNNFWMLGYSDYAGYPFASYNFNFNINSFPYLSSRDIDLDRSHANISDSNGVLQFFTNGIVAGDVNNDTMQNGDNLSPGGMTTYILNNLSTKALIISQGDLILPIPNHPEKYLLFHETCEHINSTNTWQPLQLLYSVIDMTLDSGLGGVTQKNIPVINDTLFAGNITACKHGNGLDWWVICHRWKSDMYYKLLVTPDSILGPYTQSVGSYITYGGDGQSRFSNDGEKYVMHPRGSLDLLSFDRCTGMFSMIESFPLTDEDLTGVEFSQSGNLIYAAEVAYVLQFRTDTANIFSTMDTVAFYDGYVGTFPFPLPTSFFLMERASNEKIYIASAAAVITLHTINFPDSVGLACNLQQHNLPLPGFNARTFPNHPNYFLGPLAGSACDTLGLAVNEAPFGGLGAFRVNPNPAANSFYLNYKLPAQTNAQLHLYNTLGKELIHKKLNWYSEYVLIDASGLSNGVYFIKVENDKGINASCKVIIAK